MSIRRSSLSLLAGLLFLVMARPAVAQYPELDPDFGIWYQAPVQNPATGHWYQVGLAITSVTWDVARAAAEARTYNGYPGHLATITSAAENDFIVQSVLPNSRPLYFPLWLGGYQEKGAPDYLEPGGGWRWVTGEPWSYTDWLPGQPDNSRSTYGGDADALAFHDLQGWDDLAYSSFSGTGIAGLLVEYEPAPPGSGLPPLPSPPQNLTATAASPTQINLSWADRSDDEDGFEVYRQAPDHAWVLIARLAPNSTSLADTTVLPFATYIYRVRAYNRRGPSAYWSNAAWADSALPPAAPTNLAAVDSGPQVDLTWTSNSDNETAFAIWRQTDGGAFTRIGVVPPHTTHFRDTSVSPSSIYTYEVRATNNDGASAWSNRVSTEAPPAAPTHLTATVTSPSEIDLGWTAGGGNETGIAIFRQTAGGAWVRLGEVAPRATTYADRSVQPGTGYVYEVRAHNSFLVSAWSNPVSVLTPPAP